MLVRYYNGKADSIRESNIENPYNFIEYNLSLGEYAVHKDNVLVKAGRLCNYQQPEDVDQRLYSHIADHRLSVAGAVDRIDIYIIMMMA